MNRKMRMDPEIREAILGHSTKQRSVSEQYGRISDEEFIRAIDRMTFDHGETEILVANPKTGSSSEKNGNKRAPEKKKVTCRRDLTL